MNVPLLVNVGTQSLNEPNVTLHTRLVVVVHSSFLFSQASERLLKVQQLVLKSPVVPLLLSKILCLLTQLSDEALLVGGASTLKLLLLMTTHICFVSYQLKSI